MAERGCRAVKENGKRCRAAPLQGGDYCLMHDPEHAAEMTEARRVGGRRRHRERAVSAAFDLEGLNSVSGLRRLLEIATVDVIPVDQPIPRARVLIAAVGVGAKLLEVGALEERVRALEAQQEQTQPTTRVAK